MTSGRLLAIVIALATIALVVVGTLWPVQSALAMAGAGTGADPRMFAWGLVISGIAAPT